MARLLASLIFALGLLASGGAFAQGCPQQVINAQTGTTYTVLNSDNCKKVSFSNGSSIAVTLPQAGASGNFGNTWSATFVNIGAGAVTITPTTSTIDGLSSRVLQQGQGIILTSNGTNYISSGLPPVFSTGMTYSAGTVTASDNTRLTELIFDVDGGGAALTSTSCVYDGTATGAKTCYLDVGFACTIVAAGIKANPSGSISFDVASTTYSNFDAGATHPAAGDKISASAPVAVSSATKNIDTTLTGWTTTISGTTSAPVTLALQVSGSPATVETARVTLYCRKSS
jgi:hypothetical protein